MTRRMKDPASRAEQREHLSDLHVAPISRMVDELSGDGRWMPHVAPVHGGVEARMLFVLRDPGPKTKDPDHKNEGFLCVENDDPTAERFCGLLERADIAVRDTLPWNAYPWFINKAPSQSQLREGLVPLRRLIGMMTDLRVVLLMGNHAQASWGLLEGSGFEIPASVTVLRTRHPSNQAFVGTKEERALWREEQAQVIEQAGDIVRTRRSATAGAGLR